MRFTIIIYCVLSISTILIGISIVKADDYLDEAYSTMKLTWNKSGPERYLNISYNQELYDMGICLNITNNLFNSTMKTLNKSIDQLPLTQIYGGINLPSKINLSKSKFCFNFTHNYSNTRFKIGYSTMTIDVNATVTSLDPLQSKNIIQFDDKIIIVFMNKTMNVVVLNSSNNGTTWSRTYPWGTETYAQRSGILLNSSKSFIVYTVYNEPNSVVAKNGFFNSSGKIQWGPQYTLIDHTIGSTIGLLPWNPVCVLDSNDCYHCAYNNGSGPPSGLWYINCTQGLTDIDVGVNTSDSYQHDIDIDSGNYPYIATVENANSDTHIYSPRISGFGKNKYKTVNRTSNGISYMTMTIDQYDRIFISAGVYRSSIARPALFNSSDFGQTWTSRTLSTTNVGNSQDISTSRTGNIYYIFANTSSNVFINSTNNGTTFGTPTKTSGTGLNGLSIADGRFPLFARTNNSRIYTVGVTTAGLLKYMNLSVILNPQLESTASTPTICNCTFPNSYALDKTINMSCKCNITTESYCKKLTFTGGGWLNLSSTLNASNISLAINQTIFITQTGRLNVRP